MNKRQFLGNSAKLVASAALVGALPLTAQAQTEKGYKLLDQPQGTTNPDKVEVLEYFWFGCPHCYAFEPSINAWAETKPDYVDFIREAPPLNRNWETHSRAFYAAEIMGVTDQFFDPMFNGIHAERRTLRSPNQIAEFAGELGLDEDKFRKTMDSFGVDTRIKQAMHKAMASGITGVPAVVINGKFMTSGSLAGSHDSIIRVIEELSERERSA
ncbi:MAG: thiol:disulfide interchange protein DsbA/DsbL [Granulosicoccus sp.]|nr:thiol:disulfide interchange protein DsbA/DsbL [Granulosicoccus sp.]